MEQDIYLDFYIKKYYNYFVNKNNYLYIYYKGEDKYEIF